MQLREVRLRSLSKPQNQRNVPGYHAELAAILQKRRCHISRNIVGACFPTRRSGLRTD